MVPAHTTVETNEANLPTCTRATVAEQRANSVARNVFNGFPNICGATSGQQHRFAQLASAQRASAQRWALYVAFSHLIQ